MKDYDKLDDIFNVSGDIVSREVDVEIEENQIDENLPKPTTENKRSTDIQRDYDYARGTIYSLLEKGQEAINGALELAQETESARAYEVAGQIIKSVSDTADKLMNLHKDIKEVEDSKGKGPTNVTNNALFIGSTAELSKLLKQQSKDTDEDK
jgi:hypothetical protein